MATLFSYKEVEFAGLLGKVSATLGRGSPKITRGYFTLTFNRFANFIRPSSLFCCLIDESLRASERLCKVYCSHVGEEIVDVSVEKFARCVVCFGACLLLDFQPRESIHLSISICLGVIAFLLFHLDERDNESRKTC